MREPRFDKSTIPNLAGRVLLVTGGTGGIGAELTVELAQHNPGQVVFTGRNAQAAEVTIQRIHAAAPHVAVTFVACDLADLASVQAAAARILAACPRLDLLLANAGVMAAPAGLSADGHELHFATNHLGHALLTRTLLARTAARPGADVRVVYTTSTAWKAGSLAFDRLRTPMPSPFLGRWLRCAHSKLANVLYARQLARRYPQLLALSVHPGVVDTPLIGGLGLADRWFVYVGVLGDIITPEQGTFNHLWAVSAPREQIRSGGYYEPVGILSSEKTVAARDEKFEMQLWEYTEKELEKWMS
ncbi:NAD(P)-binding protein [Xylariomycetidae sp. FL0641]|nr:NAD(P)-binding protein [Xylariomycetidae sp. FL0641]